MHRAISLHLFSFFSVNLISGVNCLEKNVQRQVEKLTFNDEGLFTHYRGISIFETSNRKNDFKPRIKANANYFEYSSEKYFKI